MSDKPTPPKNSNFVDSVLLYRQKQAEAAAKEDISSFSSAGIATNLEGYTEDQLEKMSTGEGTHFIPQAEHSQDYFHNAQSTGEALGRAAAKTVINTAANVVGGLSGAVYGIGAAFNEGRFSAVWDNAVFEGLDNFNKEINDYYKVYHSKAYDEEYNFFQKFTEGASFTDEASSTISFLAGAAITEMISGGLASLAVVNTLGKLSKVNKLLKAANTIDDVSRLANSTSRFAVNAAKAGQFLGTQTRRALTSSFYEAGISAYGFHSEMVNQMIENHKAEYGENPTEEDIERFKDITTSQGNNIFMANVALLNTSHAISFPTIFKGNLKSSLRSPINGETFTKAVLGKVDDVATKSTTGRMSKIFSKVSDYTSKGAKYGRSIVMEGLEEGSQFIMEDAAKVRALELLENQAKGSNGFVESTTDFFNFLGTGLAVVPENLSNKDFWNDFGMGALMGIGGIRSVAKDIREKEDAYDRAITKATKLGKVDTIRKSLFLTQEQLGNHVAAQKAEDDGDTLSQDVYTQRTRDTSILQLMTLGGSEHIDNLIDTIENMSIDEYRKELGEGYEHATIEDKNKAAQDLKDSAKRVKEVAQKANTFIDVIKTDSWFRDLPEGLEESLGLLEHAISTALLNKSSLDEVKNKEYENLKKLYPEFIISQDEFYKSFGSVDGYKEYNRVKKEIDNILNSKEQSDKVVKGSIAELAELQKKLEKHWSVEAFINLNDKITEDLKANPVKAAEAVVALQNLAHAAVLESSLVSTFNELIQKPKEGVLKFNELFNKVNDSLGKQVKALKENDPLNILETSVDEKIINKSTFKKVKTIDGVPKEVSVDKVTKNNKAFYQINIDGKPVGILPNRDAAVQFVNNLSKKEDLHNLQELGESVLTDSDGKVYKAVGYNQNTKEYIIESVDNGEKVSVGITQLSSMLGIPIPSTTIPTKNPVDTETGTDTSTETKGSISTKERSYTIPNGLSVTSLKSGESAYIFVDNLLRSGEAVQNHFNFKTFLGLLSPELQKEISGNDLLDNSLRVSYNGKQQTYTAVGRIDSKSLSQVFSKDVVNKIKKELSTNQALKEYLDNFIDSYDNDDADLGNAVFLKEFREYMVDMMFNPMIDMVNQTGKSSNPPPSNPSEDYNSLAFKIKASITQPFYNYTYFPNYQSSQAYNNLNKFIASKKDFTIYKIKLVRITNDNISLYNQHFGGDLKVNPDTIVDGKTVKNSPVIAIVVDSNGNTVDHTGNFTDDLSKASMFIQGFSSYDNVKLPNGNTYSKNDSLYQQVISEVTPLIDNIKSAVDNGDEVFLPLTSLAENMGEPVEDYKHIPISNKGFEDDAFIQVISEEQRQRTGFDKYQNSNDVVIVFNGYDISASFTPITNERVNILTTLLKDMDMFGEISYINKVLNTINTLKSEITTIKADKKLKKDAKDKKIATINAKLDVINKNIVKLNITNLGKPVTTYTDLKAKKASIEKSLVDKGYSLEKASFKDISFSNVGDLIKIIKLNNASLDKELIPSIVNKGSDGFTFTFNNEKLEFDVDGETIQIPKYNGLKVSRTYGKGETVSTVGGTATALLAPQTKNVGFKHTDNTSEVESLLEGLYNNIIKGAGKKEVNVLTLDDKGNLSTKSVKYSNYVFSNNLITTSHPGVKQMINAPAGQSKIKNAKIYSNISDPIIIPRNNNKPSEATPPNSSDVNALFNAGEAQPSTTVFTDGKVEKNNKTEETETKPIQENVDSSSEDLSAFSSSLLNPSQPAATLEELSKEIEHVNELIPYANISFVRGLINGHAYGKYLNNAITISDLAVRGTVYHEAFHAVSLGILSNRQRSLVYKDLRERYPLTQKEIDFHNGDINKATEEKLAEMFKEYMLTGTYPPKTPPRVKSFFGKVIQLLKDLFGVSDNTSVEKLFNDIKSGKYKNARYTSTNNNPYYSIALKLDSNSPKFEKNHLDLLPGVLRGMFMEYLKIPSNFEKFFNNNYIIDKKAFINQLPVLVRPSYNKAIEQPDSLLNSTLGRIGKHMIDNMFSNQDVNTDKFNYIFDNLDKIVTEVDLIDEDALRNEGDEGVRTSALESAHHIAPSRRMSTGMRVLTNYLISSDPNGNEEYGHLEPLNRAYPILLDKLSNSLGMMDLVEKLENLVATDPRFLEFYKAFRFKDLKDYYTKGVNNYGDSLHSFMSLYNSFEQAFTNATVEGTKIMINHEKNTQKDGKGKQTTSYTTTVKNVDGAVENAEKRIENKLNDSFLSSEYVLPNGKISGRLENEIYYGKIVPHKKVILINTKTGKEVSLEYVDNTVESNAANIVKVLTLLNYPVPYRINILANRNKQVLNKTTNERVDKTSNAKGYVVQNYSLRDSIKKDFILDTERYQFDRELGEKLSSILGELDTLMRKSIENNEGLVDLMATGKAHASKALALDSVKQGLIEFEDNADENFSISSKGKKIYTQVLPDARNRMNHTYNFLLNVVTNERNQVQNQVLANFIKQRPHLYDKVIQSSPLFGIIKTAQKDARNVLSLRHDLVSAVNKGETSVDFNDLSELDRVRLFVQDFATGRHHLIRPSDSNREQVISLSSSNRGRTNHAIGELLSERVSPTEAIGNYIIGSTFKNVSILNKYLTDILQNKPTPVIANYFKNLYGTNNLVELFGLETITDEDGNKTYKLSGTREEAINKALNKYTLDIVSKTFLKNDSAFLQQSIRSHAKAIALGDLAFNDLKDITKKFIDNNSLKNKVEGFVQSEVKSLRSRLKDTSKLDEYLSKNDLITTAVEEYIVANLNQIALYNGDLETYKSIDDLIKRGTGITGNKRRLNDSPYFVAYSNNSVDRMDGIKYDEANPTFSMLVCKEPVMRSRLAEYTSKEFGINDYNEGINSADATTFVGLDTYRHVLRASNQWSNEMEVLYQHEVAFKNNTLSNDGSFTIPETHYIPELRGRTYTREQIRTSDYSFLPIKPQGYGELYFPEGHALFGQRFNYFLKTAFVPIIPSAVAEYRLGDVYQSMIKNGIEILTMDSAVKQGALSNPEGKYHQLDKSEVGLNTNFDLNTVMRLPHSTLGIQVDISPLKHTDVSTGTQQMVMTFGYLYENGKIIDDKFEAAVSLAKEANAGRINRGIENLAFELGMGFDEASNNFYTTDTTNAKITKFLSKQLEKDLYDENVIKSLQAIADGIGLDGVTDSITIQRTLSSMINKQSIKLKRFGSSHVQSSSYMFEPRGYKPQYQNINDKEHMLSNPTLDFYYDENGKIVGLEVLVPNYIKELLGTNLTDAEALEMIKANQPELLELIGFRIPTQGLSSIEFIKIKGFLDPKYGDTIIVPSELTKKAGSDFDIDKLNIYFPNYFKDLNGVIRMTSYYKGNTEQDRYNRAYQFVCELLGKDGNIDTDNIDYKRVKELCRNAGIDLESLKDNPLSMIGALTHAQEYLIPGNSLISNASYENGLMTGHLNILKQVLADKKLAKNMLKSVDGSLLKDIADKYEYEQTYDYNVLFSINEICGKTTEIMESTGGIGISASSSKGHILGQMYNYVYSGETSVPFTHNFVKDGTNLSGAYTVGYGALKPLPINTVLEEAVSAFVDAVKDGWIFKLGVVKENTGMFLTGIRAGIHPETLAQFFKQPVIKDLFRLIKQNKSPYIVKKMSNDDIIHQLFIKYAAGGNKSINYRYMYDKHKQQYYTKAIGKVKVNSTSIKPSKLNYENSSYFDNNGNMKQFGDQMTHSEFLTMIHAYKALSEMSSGLYDVEDPLKLDTTSSPTESETSEVVQAIGEIMNGDSKIINATNPLATGEFLSPYYSAYKLIKSVLQDQVKLVNTPSGQIAKAGIDRLMELKGLVGKKADDFRNRALNIYNLHRIMNTDIKVYDVEDVTVKLADLTTEMLFSNNDIADFVTQLKNLDATKNNRLIQDLQVVKRGKDSPSNVFLPYVPKTKNDPLYSVYVEAYRELFKSTALYSNTNVQKMLGAREVNGITHLKPVNVGQMLMFADYIQTGGFSSKRLSFNSILPSEEKINLYKQVIAQNNNTDPYDSANFFIGLVSNPSMFTAVSNLDINRTGVGIKQISPVDKSPYKRSRNRSSYVLNYKIDESIYKADVTSDYSEQDRIAYHGVGQNYVNKIKSSTLLYSAMKFIPSRNVEADSVNTATKGQTFENIISTEENIKIQGENISSKGSEFAKKLTNVGNNVGLIYRGKQYINSEHAYQTWKSGEFNQAGYNLKGGKVRGGKIATGNKSTIVKNKWTKDSPKENPNTAYIFTENINSIGSSRVGNGSAIIRNNANAIGIITKKYYVYYEDRPTSKITGGWDQNFQNTEADFELFKKVNLEQFAKIDKYESKIFPQGFASDLAKIPTRFAEWLQNELLVRYGLVTELNPNKTGLISKEIKTNDTFSIMTDILTEKLKQHPELVQGINERGGLNYIKQSTHNVIGDKFWESTGQNKFIEALYQAAKNVGIRQKELNELKININDNTIKTTTYLDYKTLSESKGQSPMSEDNFVNLPEEAKNDVMNNLKKC